MTPDSDNDRNKECRAVQCSFVVKPQYMLPIHHGPQVGRDWQDRVRDGLGWRHYFTQPDGSIPYIAKQQTAEAAAAAERDWQARVREGRFVAFEVRPARDRSNILKRQELCAYAKMCRGK